MPESPRPRFEPAIIAAIIGLVGTIIVTLVTVFANRPVSSPLTALPGTEPPADTSPGTLPTVKYPDGKLLALFYDDTSFYMLNRSDAKIPINRVAFERLSDDDVPLHRFNGTSWAQFYADSTPGRCVALEIVGSDPYLQPLECGHNDFLSLRTPNPDDPTIFWTAQEGSSQFRLLWLEGGEGREVARCEISAGTCEVFLP
ncbi:MAG: hypothetical protein ABI621_09945 [Chloroflexota bacterium]